MNQHELEHLRALQQAHQDRLEVLELQAARFGISTPAHIAAEIKTIRATLSSIRTRIDAYQEQEKTESPPAFPGSFSKETRSIIVELRNLLASFYEHDSKARRVVDEAGLDQALIDFDGSALEMWHVILREAEHQERISALFLVILREYPQNTILQALWRDYQTGHDRD